MATFNYAKFIAKAKNLIARFGAPVQILRGDISIDTVAFLDIDVSETTLDQTMIIAADRVCLLPATSLDPLTSEGDKIVINNMPYRIMQPKPIGPSGQVIIWTIVARL